MSINSVSGSSPAAFSGVLDEATLGDLVRLFTVLRDSDTRLDTEVHRTAACVENFMNHTEGQITDSIEENRKLREQLTKSERDLHEVKMVHKAEVTALSDQRDSLKERLQATRHEMTESLRKEHDRAIRAEGDVDAALDGVRRLNSLNQDLNKNVRRLENELASQQNDHRMHVQGLQESIEGLKRQIQQNESRFDQTMQRIRTDICEREKQHEQEYQRLSKAYEEALQTNKHNCEEFNNLHNAYNNAVAEINRLKGIIGNRGFWDFLK